MNLAIIVALLIIAWIVYTISQSYRALQQELREIRMKCFGAPDSKYNKEPTSQIKNVLVEGLTKLKQSTERI